VVKHDDDVKKAVTIMTTKRMPAFPVVDDYGNFLGAVYLFELMGESGRVGIYAKKIPHVSPESSLLEALQVIGQTGLTWAPVVDDGKLIGVLTLQSINCAYTQRLGKGKGGAQ